MMSRITDGVILFFIKNPFGTVGVEILSSA